MICIRTYIHANATDSLCDQTECLWEKGGENGSVTCAEARRAGEEAPPRYLNTAPIHLENPNWQPPS